MYFDYKIIHSGSAGNFNLITHTDITGETITFATDIGKPFKHLEPYLFPVDVILISHIHGDHYQPATYKQIREAFPNILIIGNNEVNERVISDGLPPLDYTLNAAEGIQIADVYIKAFENEHGNEDYPVQCCGWILYNGHENILYSTDMSTTIHYRNYLDKHNLTVDTILLEANYDPKIVGFIEAHKLHSGYSIFNNGSERHMSKDEFDDFCSKYKTNDKTRCEPMHMSSTYYSWEGMRKVFKEVTDEQIEAYEKEGLYIDTRIDNNEY